MGGRGSKYKRLVEESNKRLTEQREDYSNNEPVNPEDFITDEESLIHNDMFIKLKSLGISTRESTDKINSVGLVQQQEQVEVLAKEYQRFFKEAKQDIQFASENIKDPQTGGYTAPLRAGGLRVRVVLDSKRVNNPTWHDELIRRSVNDSWHAPIDLKDNAKKYTITHEMGHVVEECIFEKLLKENPNNSKYYDARWVATKVRNDVYEICKNKYTKKGESVNMNISDYSERNSMEWFAETFANLHLSENPMPVALALSEYLERFD